MSLQKGSTSVRTSCLIATGLLFLGSCGGGTSDAVNPTNNGESTAGSTGSWNVTSAAEPDASIERTPVQNGSPG